MDLNVTPNTEIPKWSETRFFGCWNPDQGVGVYAHMGRYRKDLDMWWAHVGAYLPDGRLVVDRSWGRDGDPEFVRTGHFELAQREAGFTSTFDGVGELTTREGLARAPRGAGAGLSRMQWDFTATALSPVWDLYGGESEKHEFAGDSHTQRSFTTSGTLVADGQTYSLEGVGWRDHSSGVRAWDGYGSHHFLLAVMPEWTVHSIMLFGPEGEPRGPMGRFFYRDGSDHAVEVSQMPPMEDALCGPDTGKIVLKPASGDPIELRYELVGQLPITINDDGDNLNGVDWEEDCLSLVLGEAAAKLTAEDGTVGYAFLERGAHRDRLARPWE